MKYLANPALFSWLCACAALAVAFISQFAFGTHPCDLCILQRYPYLFIICIVPILYIVTARDSLIWLFVPLAFACTSAIAMYHVGVEQGWVSGPDGCSISTRSEQTLDALKASILNAPLVSCSDVGASFAGISMAAWNALCGIILSITSFTLWRTYYGTK